MFNLVWRRVCVVLLLPSPRLERRRGCSYSINTSTVEGRVTQVLRHCPSREYASPFSRFFGWQIHFPSLHPSRPPSLAPPLFPSRRVSAYPTLQVTIKTNLLAELKHQAPTRLLSPPPSRRPSGCPSSSPLLVEVKFI